MLIYVLKQMFDLRAVVGLHHLAKPRAGFNVAVIGVGRIREQQLDLFAERTTTRGLRANQIRRRSTESPVGIQS